MKPYLPFNIEIFLGKFLKPDNFLSNVYEEQKWKSNSMTLARKDAGNSLWPNKQTLAVHLRQQQKTTTTNKNYVVIIGNMCSGMTHITNMTRMPLILQILLQEKNSTDPEKNWVGVCCVFKKSTICCLKPFHNMCNCFIGHLEGRRGTATLFLRPEESVLVINKVSWENFSELLTKSDICRKVYSNIPERIF